MSSALDPRDPALRASLHIARYAEILAHVTYFGSERTAEVVERFGYSLEAWRDVDRAWTNGIATETATDEPAKILAFSATFHQHRARLAEERPALASITDKSPARKKSIEKPLPGAAPAGVPSFMLADAAPARSSEGQSPWAAQTSFPADRAYAAPIPNSPPPVPATAAAPLPFAKGVSAEAALQSAVEHALKVQGAAPVGPAADLGATNAMDDNDISAIARRVVPFGASPGPEVRPARDPELTLEKHAELYIELELYPEQKSAILQRYGLTASQHARIDAGWDAQLTLNPRLAAAWQQAASNHRTRLLRGT